jgi:D-alanyl-D-alanine carboxypeptidase/D-alanyl-D-alanine-endopeptidase (penicillin-binding protein 4)
MKARVSILILIFVLKISFGQSKFSEEKIAELQGRLDSICLPIKDAGIRISAEVLHADYNKKLYELNPDEHMIPASITKLVTSACAFVKLGADYSIETKVYTDDSNIKDGVINGNLYLKGFGDPDLNSNDMNYLAQEIIKKNIREITGNIVADESFFDNNYYGLSGHYNGDTGPSYWPYVNALAMDKNQGQYNPAISAGSSLQSSLTLGGVSIPGTVIVGTTPTGAKEVTQVSHSIYDVLSYMCKESDNHSAITMFKLLGAKFKSNPGSLEDGQDVIISFLSELGIDRYSYEILEGSGLTRYNQVNAEMYIKMLKYLYDDRFLFDYFMNSLSIAGKDGTLKNRMIGTGAEGNVYAKTGTLNSVSALSGYVIDADNEVLIFYIVMNGFGGNATSMRDAQDYFCMNLAAFTRK